ncbi:hypothetical protein MNBD_PLANCTO02-1374 [hydrothermal vent metagenome]|uniref:Uncharacterized protein n=1 Tax=hydrothermal vent metagenome TaxID=652676 RepID=A0A3B1DB90_9ZZZZ
MKNFQRTTKVILAATLVVGLVVMNQANGDGYHDSDSPSYSSGTKSRSQLQEPLHRANYQSGSTDKHSDDNRSSRDESNHSHSMNESNSHNSQRKDSIDSHSSDDEHSHNDQRKKSFDSHSSNDGHSHNSPRRKTFDSQSSDDGHLHDNQRRNSFDSFKKERTSSDRYRSRERSRFDDRLDRNPSNRRRSNESRYRGGRYDAESHQDRLKPASYESNRRPVSNRGRSPFYQ